MRRLITLTIIFVLMVWLIGLSQKTALSQVGGNIRNAAGAAKSQASSAASQAKSKAQSAADQAANKARSAAEGARQKIGQGSQEAQTRIEKAVDRAENEVIETEKAVIDVVEQETVKEIEEVRGEVGSLQEETAYCVTDVAGPVQARRQGGLAWLSLTRGMYLREGCAIKTGSGGRVKLDVYKIGQKVGSQSISENMEVVLSK